MDILKGVKHQFQRATHYFSLKRVSAKRELEKEGLHAESAGRIRTMFQNNYRRAQEKGISPVFEALFLDTKNQEYNELRNTVCLHIERMILLTKTLADEADAHNLDGRKLRGHAKMMDRMYLGIFKLGALHSIVDQFGISERDLTERIYEKFTFTGYVADMAKLDESGEMDKALDQLVKLSRALTLSGHASTYSSNISYSVAKVESAFQDMQSSYDSKYVINTSAPQEASMKYAIA